LSDIYEEKITKLKQVTTSAGRYQNGQSFRRDEAQTFGRRQNGWTHGNKGVIAAFCRKKICRICRTERRLTSC
jgi:hypothetical protein